MPVINCDNSVNVASDFRQDNLTCNHIPLNGSMYPEMQYTVAAAVARAAMSQTGTNYSETVEVPSSEHVAEIVGRQGCKIKALRAKTNTYIKTPVRDQEPVFVITGKKDDVKLAKEEILNAAKHFTNIRATRRNGTSSQVPNVPGHVTIKVPVRIQMVGLLVGAKGATIKRIQQQTDTHIMTPSRDKEPIFEVTGFKDNVERAKMLMYQHILNRTGQDTINGNANPYEFTFNENEAGELSKSLSIIPQIPYGYPLDESPSSSTNFWSDHRSKSGSGPTQLDVMSDLSSLNRALLDIDPTTMDIANRMKNNELSYSMSMSALHYAAPSNGSLTSSSVDTIDSTTSSSAHSSPTINGTWSFGLK